MFSRVRILTAACCALALISCGAPQKTKDSGPRGTVRFTSEIEDASLEVDEQRLGPIGLFRDQGVMLLEGTHRVVVKKPGYFDFFMLIEVRKDQLEVIEVALRAIPD